MQDGWDGSAILVKTIDPDAFLSVSSVMGVYGQGFDTIKVKTKK